MFAPKAILDDLATRIDAAETIEVAGVGHDMHSARPEWFIRTVVDWPARH